MNGETNFPGDPSDDIRAGRPQSYYDYILKTYGKAFRSGSVEALETFKELYLHVHNLGNERSTQLFIETFVPLLPEKARRRIAREFFAERQRMALRSPQENEQRKLELFRTRKKSD